MLWPVPHVKSWPGTHRERQNEDAQETPGAAIWRLKQRRLVTPGDNLRGWPRIGMPGELLWAAYAKGNDDDDEKSMMGNTHQKRMHAWKYPTQTISRLDPHPHPLPPPTKSTCPVPEFPHMLNDLHPCRCHHLFIRYFRYCIPTALATCSDPGFAVLQPSFRLGKQEKGNSFIHLRASFIWMVLAKTANDEPHVFFSTISDVLIVLLLGLLGYFPIPACSMSFSVQSIKCSWRTAVVGRQHTCVNSQLSNTRCSHTRSLVHYYQLCSSAHFSKVSALNSFSPQL